MKIKSEKGFTGIDIAISVIVLFIFVSIIAMLMYNFNSTSKEVELKSEATYLAISEIENVKRKGFENYENLNIESTTDVEGNELLNQPTEKEGFYKSIIVQDYADLYPDNSNIISNLVKKVTVKITYMFKAEEQSVEISTVLSKGD